MDGYLRIGLRSGVILLLAAGLSGCGGGNGPDGRTGRTTTGSTTSTSEGPFPTPTPEPTTTTTHAPEPTEDNPIIGLPSLPIGGDADTDSDDPARQCVDISWIPTTDANPVIPQGYAVEITGARFSAKGFEVIKSGCESSRPNCIGHVMRSGSDQCDLAVRALQDASPEVIVQVGLKGILYCPKSVGMKKCQKFADAVANEPGVTIELNPAPEPTTATDAGTATTSGD
jgi:hypothetical protein